MQNLHEQIHEAVDALKESILSIADDDEVDGAAKVDLAKVSVAQFRTYIGKLIPDGVAKAVSEARKTVSFTKTETREETKMPTRAELYADLKKRAIAQRRDGETNEGALARWIGTPEGKDAYLKYRNAPGDDSAIAAPVAPAPVVKLDGAYAQLRKLADEMCRADASLTRHTAIAKIAADPKHRELWEKAKNE